MIFISIYLFIAMSVFLILMYVDKSDNGNIEFTYPVPPQARETIFLLLGIFWPMIIIGITLIKWGDKILFKKSERDE
jgi:hypothetical protein